jgi:ABC-type transporter Mla MlaB component
LLKIVPLVGRPGLRLSGEVDLATRALFVREFDAQLGGTGDVHLELAELSFIDVGGVALLATRALAFRRREAASAASPDAGAASHPGPPLG